MTPTDTDPFGAAPPIARRPKALMVAGLIILAGASLAGCGDDYGPLHSGPECDMAADLRCPGSPLPSFTLQDVNPQSTTFETQLATEDFAGRVTVIAVFAGW